MLRKRGLGAADQIASISLVVGVLELTPAASGKMAARGLLVMRPRCQRAIVEQGVAGNAERHVAPG